MVSTENSQLFKLVKILFSYYLNFSLDPEVESLIPDGVVRILDSFGLKLSR